ncbi:MAG: 2-hydroxyacid dehydrogenase [Clostridia bacterium]|nr:2-hydroxyacid dehydrogenase [Clostridia bacterium]
MPNILLTNHYEGNPLTILMNQIPSGYHLDVLEQATKDCLLEKACNADYFLVSGRLRIEADVLNCAKKLKMIQRTGVGIDVFDIDELKKRGIPLYVNQGVNAQSVAEHTVLLILACLKRLTVIDKDVKNGIWKKQEQGLSTYELNGKTVGLIGMGNIGKRVARLLNAFGANVLFYDKYYINKESDSIAQQVDLDELYSRANIISLHCPLTAETKGLVNKESIRKMKDGVILINTARGPLINTADLLEGLKIGKVGFAGLDVYEVEPVNNTEILIQKNIITTPHIGGVSYDSFKRMMFNAIHNIVLFDKGHLKEIERCKYPY